MQVRRCLHIAKWKEQESPLPGALYLAFGCALRQFFPLRSDGIIATITMMSSSPERERPHFSAVLERLSSALARESFSRIREQVPYWLGQVDQALGLNRSVIANFVPNRCFQVFQQWNAGMVPTAPLVKSEVVPWINEQLMDGRMVVLDGPRSLPANADNDRKFFSLIGTKAVVLVPFVVDGRIVGGGTFEDCLQDRRWSPVLLRRIELVAEVFGNAMARNLLADENASLQQKAEGLGRFALSGEMAAAIAHEVSHPLGAILANAQTAQRILRHARPNLADLTEIIDDIVAGERRASAYIDKVRRLFVIDNAKSERVSFASLLEATASLLRKEIVARDIALRLDIEAGLPDVTGDRTGFEQVMVNLLLNAVEAVSSVDSAERCVTLRAFCRSALWLTVEVEDTGNGIDQRDVALVFEPLFTTKRKGTGMGLSIVRSIIKSHGGIVHVRDTSPSGTTFTFSLPVAP
jgi:signal transduction histidine kinase